MAGRKPRGRETAWDMILSMAAVTATVGVIMLLAWRPQQEVVQSVDYPAAVENAKLSAIWPISIPSELPKGYRATSATAQQAPDLNQSHTVSQGMFVGLLASKRRPVNTYQFGKVMDQNEK